MVPVSVRALTVRYGTTTVLDAIDCDIAAGELFFLLGPSGCGKTTLLRAIGGFVAPAAGSIRFGDQDVSSEPAEKRGIGMVFQHYALWPHRDVAGNVAFGLEVQGVPAAERHRRVDEALASVELPGFAARKVAELSGGQQQRVALARALVVRPRVLLLDEPLSNLDTRLRHAMRSTIRRVCKQAGVTAIYVTHDQHEALATADRIGVLSGGRLVQVDTPRALFERPATRAVAEFLGATNLLPGRVVADDAVECALGRLVTDAIPAGVAVGADVVLCLRPERVRVDESGVNRFATTLVESQFFGASAELTLAVGDQRLVAHEAAPRQRRTGDSIDVAIDPADVVVLKP
ncbi:MAG TPA: ABC transporter ATP-binding protein [Planctomycetota bacterium]|nr:ABC transporter ATP-binding protein [Planctomycetota bacterium]